MPGADVDYAALARCSAVLDRQQQHAERIEQYLRTHGDITDSTGWILSSLRPLAQAAVELGAQAAAGAAVVGDLAAEQVRSSITTYAEADRQAHEDLRRVMARLDVKVGSWDDPRTGLAPLGPAAGGAAADHGDQDSFIWEKAAGIPDTVRDALDSGGELTDQVGGWRGGSSVAEALDASSYLVTPQPSDNPVQDLRWNAGLILGSIDWVAEKVLGISVLAECVFKPLGGDWRAIDMASDAWTHAGEASFAIGRNAAALSSGSVDGWKGAAGDGFRVAMVTYSGACVGLSTAYEYASGLLSQVALASKLACAGIGIALNEIVNRLTRLAAQAAVPLVGWAMAVYEGYATINKMVGLVRLVYNILEGLADMVVQYVEAQAQLLDAAALVEDLLETLARRSGATA